jgi:hypothetical protein
VVVAPRRRIPSQIRGVGRVRFAHALRLPPSPWPRAADLYLPMYP